MLITATSSRARYYGDVASRYAYDDGGGEIGLILAITQPFCPSCSRARLSAEDRILLCLFAEPGVNLHDLLRVTNLEIATAVQRLWSGRDDRHSELRGLKVARVNG